jgi:ferredoxin-NADP reductase
MKINVKGHIRDLLAFRRLVPTRRKRFARASAQPLGPGPMNRLAEQLHPHRQNLLVTAVRDETHTTRTFRLIPDPDSDTRELAYFRAGQYLSLKIELNQVGITRPYSISSAPYEALGTDGFYEITIRRIEDGFFTPYLWDNWAVGTKVESSGPSGQFYYEPMRDEHKIVGLAGGTGITPFCSMAKEIVYGDMDAELLLLYGSSDKDDIVYYELLKELEEKAAGKIQVVHVLSCDEIPLEGCEQGFITASLIEKYADIGNSTFFACGPQSMHEFVMQELATLDLPIKRIRREVFGEARDITRSPGFQQEVADKRFQIKVHIGGITTEIPAQARETVLVAMERAGLMPPSQCRSGECGVCHSLLTSGDVYVHPDRDGRRAADRQFGYIHPCSSYPVTDLEISVPRGNMKES